MDPGEELPETKGKLDLLNYEFLHKRNMLFGTPEYVTDKIHELKSELNLQIVLNPDFSDFEYKKLAPIACALCYSISMTITKYTSDKDNSYTQMTHLYIGATCRISYYL